MSPSLPLPAPPSLPAIFPLFLSCLFALLFANLCNIVIFCRLRRARESKTILSESYRSFTSSLSLSCSSALLLLGLSSSTCDLPPPPLTPVLPPAWLSSS